MIRQTMHKKCGGIITVANDKNEIVFICDKCAGIFRYNIKLPQHEEWRNINKRDGIKLLK